MSKRVVYYLASPDNRIEIGKPAYVQPINHPDGVRVSNTKPVFTSRVCRVDYQSGEFETQNTIYIVGDSRMPIEEAPDPHSMLITRI